MAARDTLVTVGRVSGLHGVRGWIKVYSYTDPPTAIFGYAPWTLAKGDERRIFDLGQTRQQGSRLIAQLAGVDDRDEAAQWVDAEILTGRDRLPPTAEGEFYWADLIGLSVETTDGKVLGRVERLFETGANDVLVVSGDRERLVPWVTGEVIVEVDLEHGRIRVDWDTDI